MSPSRFPLRISIFAVTRALYDMKRVDGSGGHGSAETSASVAQGELLLSITTRAGQPRLVRERHLPRGTEISRASCQ